MRKALLIGSQTFGLKGVNHDLDLMERTLGELDFTPIRRGGETATREGILEGWRRLIREAQPEDAIVIYYAGHGGRAPNPDWKKGSSEPRHLQFIVPTDMERNAEAEFRGILNLELSLLLASLTARCGNVAVLLDCCHAARLVRGARGRPRALAQEWREGIGSHLARIKSEIGTDLRHIESNPHAVRLAAAGAHQSAFEDPGESLGGYFTEALAEGLAQVKTTPVSWEILGRWVREQVLIMEPRQRPELEGPVERLLFQKEEEASSEMRATPKSGLTFFCDGPKADLPSLRGGRLHGVAVGNRYALLELGQAGDKRRVATAEVTRVLGGVSRVRIEGDMPRDGATAQPLRELFPKRTVRLEAGVPEKLFELITRSPLLEVAPSSSRSFMARVAPSEGGVCIFEQTDAPLTYPTKRLAVILENLTRMAHASTLRELRAPLPSRLQPLFGLEWGTVEAGGRKLLKRSLSGSFQVGDRIFVSLSNRGSTHLYANLYDIGISRKVTLLNDSARSGHELQPRETWCFGYRVADGLRGIPLSWPPRVPATHPRLETLVAILSDRPLDLTVLENRGVKRQGGYALSSLEKTLRARCLGGTRSQESGQGEDIRYAIRHLDIELWPRTKRSR